MKRLSFLLHALSPLHCGTGQGVDIIDLPIARMRSTGIPFVPGSSLKGVMRSAAPSDDKTFAVYGPETTSASDNAGALVVGDARLLLLPIRSFRGAFAWVTSPLLLHLAARDLLLDNADVPKVPDLTSRGAIVIGNNRTNVHNNKLYLEDIDLDVKSEPVDSPAGQWMQLLSAMLPETERRLLQSRLTIVDDETMSFFWETATQVDARNRINAQGVVVDGALWYEESLPPETILIGQLAAEQSRRRDVPMSSDDVLAYALPPGKTNMLQIGGKATVGRGVCKVYTQVSNAL